MLNPYYNMGSRNPGPLAADERTASQRIDDMLSGRATNLRGIRDTSDFFRRPSPEPIHGQSQAALPLDEITMQQRREDSISGRSRAGQTRPTGEIPRLLSLNPIHGQSQARPSFTTAGKHSGGSRSSHSRSVPRLDEGPYENPLTPGLDPSSPNHSQHSYVYGFETINSHSSETKKISTPNHGSFEDGNGQGTNRGKTSTQRDESESDSQDLAWWKRFPPARTAVSPPARTTGGRSFGVNEMGEIIT